MIEAYITNLGKYNEGELIGEYLRFPADKEEVQGLLSQIYVDGIMYEEYFITDYYSGISGLTKCLGEYESIDELNYLALLLEELEPYDIGRFEAAVAYGEHSGNVQDLINLAQNLDYYDFMPDIKDHEDLGRYVLENMEGREIPDWMEDYFDYDSYGRDFDLNSSGRFTENGYIISDCGSFKEYYSGRNDIPDEYKIFAYPPPEKSIQKALAAYKELIADTARNITELSPGIESRPVHDSR